MLLNFRVSGRSSQNVLAESLKVTPELEPEIFISQPEKNRFDRFQLTDLSQLTLDYKVEVENFPNYLDPDSLRKLEPYQLDQGLMPYLFPSRYCQSDRLGRFAWQNFGHITPAYDQVHAITEWIHENVEYSMGTTSSITSAYDTVTECVGVCRDFAHLGIALCRALNIPARYCTGYAYKLEPMDFHACFEAYIGGHWILFDATRLCPLNSFVRIGFGRDAADVSVCTAFGTVYPGQNQICYEMHDRDFAPIDTSTTAIAMDQNA